MNKYKINQNHESNDLNRHKYRSYYIMPQTVINHVLSKLKSIITGEKIK